jgi:hypothetical protein
VNAKGGGEESGVSRSGGGGRGRRGLRRPARGYFHAGPLQSAVGGEVEVFGGIVGRADHEAEVSGNETQVCPAKEGSPVLDHDSPGAAVIQCSDHVVGGAFGGQEGMSGAVVSQVAPASAVP